MTSKNAPTIPDVVGHIRAIAWDRDETDPCERGTEGCSIDHTTEGRKSPSCETW